DVCSSDLLAEVLSRFQNGSSRIMLRRSSKEEGRMGKKAVTVGVSERQRGLLEGLCRAAGTSQQLAERCRIVLLSAEDETNEEQGAELGIDRQRVRRWRGRWAEAEASLADAEREKPSDKDLLALLRRVLSDEPRAGAPPKFTPEQVAEIIALACEPPGESGLPVSHWTPPEF